jgi:hypothetical protein
MNHKDTKTQKRFNVSNDSINGIVGAILYGRPSFDENANGVNFKSRATTRGRPNRKRNRRGVWLYAPNAGNNNRHQKSAKIKSFIRWSEA